MMKKLWDTVVGLGALAMMAVIGLFFLWQFAVGFGNVMNTLAGH